jgi:hypothetical protein
MLKWESVKHVGNSNDDMICPCWIDISLENIWTRFIQCTVFVYRLRGGSQPESNTLRKLRIQWTLRFSHFFITDHRNHSWYLLSDSVDTRTVELMSTHMLISEMSNSMENGVAYFSYECLLIHALSIVESSFQRTYWLFGTLYYRWYTGMS